MKKCAIAVFSGKIFNKNKIQEEISQIKKRIIEELRQRETCILTFTVVVSGDSFELSPCFLREGFEVIPAENEDLEIAFECIRQIEQHKPDELILGHPLNSLNRIIPFLSQKVILTALTKSTPEYLTPCLDHTITLNEEETQQETSEQNSISSVIPATRLETDENWHRELERIVLNNGKKMPVLQALYQLDAEYSWVQNLYLKNPRKFTECLPDTLIFADEDPPMLYHKTHPDYQPISASQGIQMLNIGGESIRETSVIEYPREIYRYDPEKTLIQLSIMRETCRWVVQRDKLLMNPQTDFNTDIKPQYDELVHLGKENSIYLWQLDTPLDENQFNTLEKIYACLEIAVQVFEIADSDSIKKELVIEAVTECADAICMLKTTLMTYGIDFNKDEIQKNFYGRLKQYAKEKEIFFRQLRRDYQIDSSRCEELTAQLENIFTQLNSEKNNIKKAEQELKKIEYHLKQIDRRHSVDDWQKVMESVDRMVNGYNEPISSLRLRNVLMNYLDRVPQDMDISDSFAQVIQSIELYLDQCEEKNAASEEILLAVPEIIQKVRHILNGKKVVFIGGTPQEHLKNRLEAAFNIELIWDESNHGDSLDRYRSYINDDNVVLFLIYIPWASHKHSEELAQLVQEAGKNFIRLPKGTNPAQIANAINQQMNYN